MVQGPYGYRIHQQIHPFPGNPPVGEVIRMLGNRIVVLHLNDNDTLSDQYKFP